MTEAVVRVSIVLPVRNGARYLAESVRSVEAQSLRDWELIAVDDGSTDATPEILATLAAQDGRIRVVRNDPALCLPGALNRGFEAAQGSLLTWTSDDNVFRPEALASMVATLEQRHEADVVYADYTLIDGDGRELERRSVPQIEHLGYSNVVGPCFLFRRHVWQALGGYADDLFLAEDYDFWLRAVARFRFLRLASDLYLYRTHPGALGTSRRYEVGLATARALERSLPLLPRRMRFAAMTRLEDLAMEAGQAAKAHSWRRRALFTAPLLSARRIISRLRSS